MVWAAKLAVVVVCAAGTAACAMGARDSRTAASSSQDQAFASMAARSSAAEIEMGRLGMQKATDPQVRAFAQMMAADHSRNSDGLAAAASGTGTPLPSQPTAEQQREMERLAAMAGPAFDQAYMQQMIAEHQKAVALFQQQAEKGANPSLKTYAQESLPALQDHLRTARLIAAQQRG